MNPYPHNLYPNPDADEETPQPPLHFHRLPAGHGPKSLQTQFVRAQGTYDELGRSVHDGFGAEVGTGVGEGGVEDGKGKGKQRERDPDALSFWRGLELDKGASGSSSRSSPSEAITIGVGPPGDIGGNGATLTTAVTVISPSVSGTTTRNRERSTPTPTTAPLVHPTPLQIPRSQWFIRRALAAKARVTPPTPPTTSNPSTSATPEPNPNPNPSTSSSNNSIASLLDLPSPSDAAYKPPNHYHIKPNNIGWKLLEKGGWNEMGGLGRPEGWDEEVERRRVALEVKKEELVVTEAVTSVGASGSQSREEGKEEGKGIIDLTLGESDSDDDDDSGGEADPTTSFAGEPPRFGEQTLDQLSVTPSTTTSTHNPTSNPGPNLLGPGRTAPIPTYLKSDLSGIGHRPIHTYSTLTSARVTRVGEAPKKRVTHSAAELRALERGKVVRPLGEGEMEKRKRGKAKRDAKRDREQTKRLRGLMFS